MRMAVLRSCALDIQRLALLLGPWQPALALASTSPWPLATTAISSSSLAAISAPPPHFFSNSNVVYSDRSEELKRKLAIFSKHQQQAFSNRTDTHKENIAFLFV
jgi:hypothetical protein